MLWIILGISIITFIICIILGNILDDTDLTEGLGVGSITLAILCFIALLISLGCYNSTKSTANSQIKVYEEQNEIIMAQIEPLVEKYLNYEKETYSTLKVDSNTLVAMSMYPELKGDEFVQSQIKIIMENQKKITDLKLSKAKLNAYKMWIFMGE